jgi:hypothetical protein
LERKDNTLFRFLIQVLIKNFLVLAKESANCAANKGLCAEKTVNP